MAYNYDLNSTHRLVIIRNASSKWTGTDILESAEKIVTDDRYEPDFDWVYDLRFIHDTVVTVVEMEQIVERFRVFRERGIMDEGSRSVMVGADEDLQHTGALYQKRADHPDHLFTVVETMEEARKWLGLEKSASEIGLTQ